MKGDRVENLKRELLHYRRWSDVPSNLMSKSKLKEKGYKAGTVSATVYQMMRHTVIDLYDIREAVLKEPATEKQLLSIKRAREAKDRLHTCIICGRYYRHVLKDGICRNCLEMQEQRKLSEKAKATFRKWLDEKNYVILDVETTGLEEDCEVIEVSVLSMNGDVLVNTLVKPIQPIPEEVICIHGITNDMVKDALTWDKVFLDVQNACEGKVILAFNSEFDIRLMRQSCERHGITWPMLKDMCIMHEYCIYANVNGRISLQKTTRNEGIYTVQDHRSLGDCQMALELIRKVANFKGCMKEE